jgi:adenylate cyclase
MPFSNWRDAAHPRLAPIPPLMQPIVLYRVNIMHEPTFKAPIRDEQREVTLLFADLRGFTELATTLDTDPLFCELLSHVMDCLTAAVVEQDGFVIDYYGDSIMAMWNAPAEQPDHAERACRAGLRMLATLPEVTAEWMRVIQTELRLGIGIHTGAVQIGNAGSTHRVKYGARGPNVHLASRVEAATKELGITLVATQATIERLPRSFATNRVCRARMPGLQQPVNLYAVGTSESNASCAIAWQTYDQALRHFEEGQFQYAADQLANLGANTTEVPAAFLLTRTLQELGRHLRRRSTDKPAVTPGGIIAISTK